MYLIMCLDNWGKKQDPSTEPPKSIEILIQAPKHNRLFIQGLVGGIRSYDFYVFGFDWVLQE